VLVVVFCAVGIAAPSVRAITRPTPAPARALPIRQMNCPRQRQQRFLDRLGERRAGRIDRTGAQTGAHLAKRAHFWLG
jgi:hypothetical protein